MDNDDRQCGETYFGIQTVKYFKSIEHVHQALIGKENLGLQGELLSSASKSRRSGGKGHQMVVKQLLSGDDSIKKDDEKEEEEDDSPTSPTKKRRTTMSVSRAVRENSAQPSSISELPL